MTRPAYQLFMPEQRSSGVVFSSPHSGRDYGWAFLRQTALDQHAIRSSEDAYVDTLLGGVPGLGAPLLTATMPRAFVDLNRAAEELDPALIDGVFRGGHNPRVTSGLGVVPRVVAGGRAIYRGKLTLKQAEGRIRDYWRPYHEALVRLLQESRQMFGAALLIDVHSMPHEAIEAISTLRGGRPDVVLGDRFGASASTEIVERVEAAFAAAGLKVARNAPFAGAYITQAYGRPSRAQHVVQVEIDRALYLDEARIRPGQNFDDFRRVMTSIAAEIVGVGRADTPLAAE